VPTAAPAAPRNCRRLTAVALCWTAFLVLRDMSASVLGKLMPAGFFPWRCAPEIVLGYYHKSTLLLRTLQTLPKRGDFLRARLRHYLQQRLYRPPARQPAKRVFTAGSRACCQHATTQRDERPVGTRIRTTGLGRNPLGVAAVNATNVHDRRAGARTADFSVDLRAVVQEPERGVSRVSRRPVLAWFQKRRTAGAQNGGGWHQCLTEHRD